MIPFRKRAENILSKFKTDEEIQKYRENLHKKIQEKYLIETYFFSKQYNIKIIYQNIDFIRIKLLDDNFLLKIEDKLKVVYTYQDIFENKTDFTKLQNISLFDNKFFIFFSWLTFWNQKLLYDIYDYDKNKIWQIVIKNPKHRKIWKNVINSLELSWLFFKCYEDYFFSFLEYFKIDLHQKDILKRLDYCIDIKWIEVPEILNFIKPVYKKSKSVNWLTHTDKKKMSELTTDLKFWRTETFINFFNSLNDLKIYDKILDLVDNYMKRKVDWKNPYQDYLDSDLPILRIELKKKWEAFANIEDNSIEFILDHIQELFFDYLKRYFYIDFSLYENEDSISLNWKKIYLAKQEKQKKILHSFIMAQAYLKNIEDYTSKNELYKFLLELYPDIPEKANSLELLDEFDVYDYIREIFPYNPKNENNT